MASASVPGGRAVLIISDAEDQVCPAFAAYCRERDVPVIQVTGQADTELYLQIGETTELLLRLRQASGAQLTLQPDDLAGVWFRNLPQPAADLDPAETRYVNAEFYASLITLLHLLPVPCLGLPSVPSLVPCNRSEWHIRHWYRQRGINVDADADMELLRVLPIRDYLLPLWQGHDTGSGLPSYPTSLPAASALQDETADVLYYVLCGRQRQVLVRSSQTPPTGAAEAAATAGDLIAQGLSFQTAIVAFSRQADGQLALVGVSQYLPDHFVLSDPDWYFAAVLETLGRV